MEGLHHALHLEVEVTDLVDLLELPNGEGFAHRLWIEPDTQRLHILSEHPEPFDASYEVDGAEDVEISILV